METALTGAESSFRTHPIPNPVEVALQIGFELFDGLTVHAGRAAIGFDRL